MPAPAPLSDGMEKKKRGRPKKELVKTNEPGNKVPLPTEGNCNRFDDNI